MPIPDNLTMRTIERRLENLEAQVLASVPSDAGALPTPSSILTTLASGTVGASQATVAHGLSYTPKIYAVVMVTAGTMWQSQAPDATNIYLTADAASRQANIWLGR